MSARVSTTILLLALAALVAPPAAARRDPAAASGSRATREAKLHETRPQARPELLSPRAARRYMDNLARRESRFYQPGVGYDGKSGLTFDGVNIDFRTGLPAGVRNWSAPSKESVHVALLVKALEGDRTARLMLSPDPRHPALARKRALEVLTKKIASYERFNREYPGFGGFLPWYTVKDGKMAPIPDVKGSQGWESRVPALDNGQLAWSLYHAANALEELGERELGERYRAAFQRMSRNVVGIFYDPKAQKMRAEAKLVRGSKKPPAKNAYALNEKNPYFLTDSYEGLLLCHFADLFGNWSRAPAGKDAIWATPRRQPGSFTTAAGKKITIAKAWVGSSHEEWGQQILPFSEVAIDRKLFLNAQRARTAYSAERGIPGLFASTHRPVNHPALPEYAGMLGFRAPEGTLERSRSRSIVAPYAVFPLALAPGGTALFATWLKTMLDAPRMLGPYGMGESASVSGNKIAPCLTWDGKALPMLAWMGGIRGDVRRYLARDGKLQPFVKRVEADYRLFEGIRIEGTDQPLRAPTATIPRAMSDFAPPGR